MFQIVEKGNINKQGKRMAEFFHSSAQQMQQILCTVNILTECLKKPKQGVPQAFFPYHWAFMQAEAGCSIH